MRPGHSRSQRCQVCDRKGRSPGTQRMAPVSHAVGTVGVVAPRDLTDPIRRIARHDGHSGCRHAASQHPEEVPVGTLDRITYPAIAVVEFFVSQVGFEVDTSWHVPVLQLHAATPYNPHSARALAAM